MTPVRFVETAVSAPGCRNHQVWLLVGGLLLAPVIAGAAPPPAPEVLVEVEEEVYSYEPANNGAGPMWCQGSTCLVRAGERVLVSALETLAGMKPLNNCRWVLYQRGPEGWGRLAEDEADRTREPCPVVVFSDGRVFLSANPTLQTDREAYSGPARPEVLEFRAELEGVSPRVLRPRWRGDPEFTEHSYRSFAADGRRRELILFQNVGYTHAEWTFLDAKGEWSAQGQLRWPREERYAQPQPVRICYPNVALKDRAVYFCGVSDIVEPNPEWRAFKKSLTGQEWDYDFRRLFFTWTDDITSGGFAEWIEIASRETTCGWITPGDLYVDPAGDVHVLWTERAIDERLREKFFPEARQSHALNHAVVRRGQVIRRQSLVLAEEGSSELRPGRGRFQVNEEGRLFVVYYMTGRDSDGRAVMENRVLEVNAEGVAGPAAAIPLRHPLADFFAATPRAGCAPSGTLDLLGPRPGTGRTLGYARVRLK